MYQNIEKQFVLLAEQVKYFLYINSILWGFQMIG